MRAWCHFFGRLLHLEHYLLPTEENGNEGEQAPVLAEPAAGMALAAQHQALLLVREPQGVQAYVKPSYFPLRIIALLIALSFTSMVTSVFACVVPGFHLSIVFNADHVISSLAINVCT